MTTAAAEDRLAHIFVELHRLGLPALVMGGQAVRFHGVDRSTIDFDLVVALSPLQWADLPRLLSESPVLGPAREGPSWRPDHFRRFVIGTLPDGREERLRILAAEPSPGPVCGLDARKVVGRYGGADVGFLGIEDLLRSKETEREDDWRDVRLLEEIADEQRLNRDVSPTSTIEALANLRSQRGFQTVVRRGLLETGEATKNAAAQASHPVSRAFLAPYAAGVARPERPAGDAIEDLLAGLLASVQGATSRHLALVEAVRRLYQLRRMAEDRADKERHVGV